MEVIAKIIEKKSHYVLQLSKVDSMMLRNLFEFNELPEYAEINITFTDDKKGI